jgi:hypothetical protein
MRERMSLMKVGRGYGRTIINISKTDNGCEMEINDYDGGVCIEFSKNQTKELIKLLSESL